MYRVFELRIDHLWQVHLNPLANSSGGSLGSPPVRVARQARSPLTPSYLAQKQQLKQQLENKEHAGCASQSPHRHIAWARQACTPEGTTVCHGWRFPEEDVPYIGGLLRLTQKGPQSAKSFCKTQRVATMRNATSAFAAYWTEWQGGRITRTKLSPKMLKGTA